MNLRQTIMLKVTVNFVVPLVAQLCLKSVSVFAYNVIRAGRICSEGAND